MGTAAYMAPEMWKSSRESDGYDSSVDIWALGVTAYLLMSGEFPHWDTDRSKLQDLICENNLSFAGDKWKDISSEAKCFVKALMQKQPKRRLRAALAMEHPWIRKWEDPQLHSADKLDRSILDSLQARPRALPSLPPAPPP